MAYGTLKCDNIVFDNGGTDKLVTVSGLFFSTSGALTVTGTISGGNVTAPTATFTTLTGTTTAGTTATFTSGSFTSLTGVTTTGTTATFTSGSFTSLTGVTTTVTSGVFSSGIATAPSVAIGSGTTYKPGVYSPGTDQVAISTNGVVRLTTSTTAVSSALAIDHPLGAAGTPSITFTGDLNTGIYSPAADHLAITTGGIRRIMVDNNGYVQLAGQGSWYSGNVEIVTNPSYGASSNASLVLGGPDNGYVDNSRTSAWRLLATGSASGQDLTIGGFLRTGTWQERLRVTSGGLLGLGTSGPTAPLHLVSASSDPVLIKTTGSSTYNSLILENDTGSKVAVGIGGSTVGGSVQDAGYVGTISNKSFYINTNNTQRVTVTAAGLVGIGTTSPQTLLNISEGVAGATTIFTCGVAGALNGSQAISLGTYLNTLYGCKIKSHYSYSSSTSTSLSFETSNAGTLTEAVRIDSSGRLLVGTSSARANFFNSSFDARLQVEGITGNGSAISVVRNSSDTDSPILIFGKSRGATLGSNTIVQNNATPDILGYISFQGNDGTEFVESASIKSEVDGTPGANDMPGRLVFSTTADGAASPTERMRISNAGNVGIGTTSFVQKLNVTGSGQDIIAVVDTNASSTNAGILFSNTRAATTANYYLIGYANSVNTLNVFTNGNIQNTNNSYGAISDARLKENIVDAGSQWADLKALQVRKYNFKEGQTHTQIGLVAQEAELISPGLVSESPDRDEEGNDLGTVTKSVNYSVLYMKAVKALQEAMERIEALEADVAALKGA